jgi:hypothetical protein
MLLEILFIFSAVQLHALDLDQNIQIAEFVANLIKDLNSQSSDTRDVVVLRFGMFSNNSAAVDDVFDLIIKAVPEENPLVVPAFNVVYKDINMREAAVVIIVSDALNAVSR